MKRGGFGVAMLLVLMPVAALAVATGLPVPPAPSPGNFYAWVDASYRCGQISRSQFEHLELASQDLSTVLEVYVDQQGSVEKVVLVSSSGSPLFDQAVLQTVGSWRYRPKIQYAKHWASQVRLRVDMLGEGKRVSVTWISTFDDRIGKLRLEPCK